jgi:cation diffusion facilitator CzcD-associated flavoprotein CzcO
MAAQQKADYDVIAVGAGFAGLGLIHYMREAGLSIRVFDKASDIGGTWTWNRYPGAASEMDSALSRLGRKPQLYAFRR